MPAAPHAASSCAIGRLAEVASAGAAASSAAASALPARVPAPLAAADAAARRAGAARRCRRRRGRAVAPPRRAGCAAHRRAVARRAADASPRRAVPTPPRVVDVDRRQAGVAGVAPARCPGLRPSCTVRPTGWTPRSCSSRRIVGVAVAASPAPARGRTRAPGACARRRRRSTASMRAVQRRAEDLGAQRVAVLVGAADVAAARPCRRRARAAPIRTRARSSGRGGRQYICSSTSLSSTRLSVCQSVDASLRRASTRGASSLSTLLAQRLVEGVLEACRACGAVRTASPSSASRSAMRAGRRARCDAERCRRTRSADRRARWPGSG